MVHFWKAKGYDISPVSNVGEKWKRKVGVEVSRYEAESCWKLRKRCNKIDKRCFLAEKQRK